MSEIAGSGYLDYKTVSNRQISSGSCQVITICVPTNMHEIILISSDGRCVHLVSGYSSRRLSSPEYGNTSPNSYFD